MLSDFYLLFCGKTSCINVSSSGGFLLQADVLFKCSILAFVSFNLFVFSRNDLCARTRFGEAMHANTFISGGLIRGLGLELCIPVSL